MRDLARVKDLQQGAIHDQGLRISHQLLGHDGASSQGFEEPPELAEAAAVERGGMEADHPREEVAEEAGGLAQEGTFGSPPSKLPEERQGEDLRVREPLEGGVAALPLRVERGVGVVDLAKQGDESFFQGCVYSGVCCAWVIRCSFGGDYYGWPSFYLTNHATHI